MEFRTKRGKKKLSILQQNSLTSSGSTNPLTMMINIRKFSLSIPNRRNAVVLMDRQIGNKCYKSIYPYRVARLRMDRLVARMMHIKKDVINKFLTPL